MSEAWIVDVSVTDLKSVSNFMSCTCKIYGAHGCVLAWRDSQDFGFVYGFA